MQAHIHTMKWLNIFLLPIDNTNPRKSRIYAGPLILFYDILMVSDVKHIFINKKAAKHQDIKRLDSQGLLWVSFKKHVEL